MELGGPNGDETAARVEAKQILNDIEMHGLNARQPLLKQKKPLGGGINLKFPIAEDIEAEVTGRDRQAPTKEVTLIDVYGDGSHTTPTKWWAALGGYGFGYHVGTAMLKLSRQGKRRTSQEHLLDRQEALPDKSSLPGYWFLPYPCVACMQPIVQAWWPKQNN